MTTTPPPGPQPGPEPAGEDPGPAATAGTPGAGTSTGDTATHTATRAATDTDGGPRVSGEHARDLGRMRRTVGPDRYVAGVAGGLARHLDLDPVLVRVLLVVLTFFGGAGILLYGVAWLVVPEDGATSAPLSLDERSRTVVLAVTGVLAVVALLGDAWGPGFFPWPLALVALLAYLLLRGRDRRRSEAGTPPGWAPPAWSGPAPGTPPYTPTGAAAYADPAAPGHGDPAAPAYGAPAAPAYAAAPVYGTGWAPVVPPPAPVAPRRRGPRLFAFTLALVVFGLGVLGLVDVAGADVADAAYPALAVGTTGAMLVLGAFWGRAGGLIALGLAATVALVAATAADRFDGERTLLTPATGAEVEDSYDLEFGELVLDLRDVAPEELDGRTVTVDGEAGRIEVVVPDGLSVEGRAEVHGPGAIEAFGSEEGGFDRSRELTGVAAAPGPGTGAPTLTLELELEAGQIEVTTR